MAIGMFTCRRPAAAPCPRSRPAATNCCASSIGSRSPPQPIP